MKTQQWIIAAGKSLESVSGEIAGFGPQLVIVFGDFTRFEGDSELKKLHAATKASVVGCSTAGEIAGEQVLSGSVVVTAVKFNKPTFKTVYAGVGGVAQSEKCGEEIAEKLQADDLKAIFVLGQGLDINGSALIAGMRKHAAKGVVITGGLAGDNGNFKKTYLVHNDKIADGGVVAVGFYGDHLEFGFGSRGGWEPFGPTRKVTKAEGTKLYELDGEKALNIYKSYLKDFAKDLPASGLLFPFAILDDNEADSGLIRTILGIDEAEGSLVLAGDIHPGQLVRLMHTKANGLLNGANEAATLASEGKQEGGLGILVSCVGRKLVLGEDVDEEIEEVRESLPATEITGFYSYGEICPFRFVDDCQLHNQTMTVTYITERDSA